MIEVFLSIGTNLGDRFKNIKECIGIIQLNSSIECITWSKIYETLPMYNSKQNKFLNLILKIKTSLKPMELLSEVKLIESEMGRTVNNFKNQPRLIDIDILTYGDSIVNENELIIPHPKIIERAFVLKPWSDIAPDYKLLEINKTISELISNLDINTNIIKLYDKSL